MLEEDSEPPHPPVPDHGIVCEDVVPRRRVRVYLVSDLGLLGL